MDISTGAGAKRTHWAFNYKAHEVLAGAKIKQAFHQERLAFWQQKHGEVKGKIKEDGIDFEESLSNMHSNSYRQTGVSVRDDLMRDLQECNQRVSVHRDKIDGYEAWIEVLSSQGAASLELTQDDWLYFFSKPK